MNAKRLLIVAALAAAISFVSSIASAWECTPGAYSGKTWSVTKELSGFPATLAVTKSGEMCVLKLSSPGAGLSEEWELTGNKLVQKEYYKDGKKAKEYGATLEVRNGVEGYYIDCKDGECDAGADSRYFWRFATPGNKIIYSVWGVAPEKQSNPSEKAKKRHEYTFNTLLTSP